MLTIDDIKVYPQNAKIHPIEQQRAMASIVGVVGWRQPSLVNQKGYLVVGLGRFLTWLRFKDEYNLKPIWIIDDKGNTIHGEPEKTPLTEEQERAYRLADNKLNESDWKMDLVVEELKLLSDEMIDLTGFDRNLLFENEENFDEEKAIEEAVKNPLGVKSGDLYLLGGKVLCPKCKKETSI